MRGTTTSGERWERASPTVYHHQPTDGINGASSVPALQGREADSVWVLWRRSAAENRLLRVQGKGHDQLPKLQGGRNGLCRNQSVAVRRWSGPCNLTEERLSAPSGQRPPGCLLRYRQMLSRPF